MTLRRGVRIGVDVGTVRGGVARTDPEGILSIPVRTLRRADNWSDVEELATIVAQYDAIEVLVGLPRHLKGGEGARRYARRVKVACPGVRVAMVDERLSSTQAHQRLRAHGVPETDHRGVIDQVAAQIIIAHALDTERISGRAPGEPVDAPESEETGR